MVRAANEKMLGANLPLDYVDEFWQKAAPEGTSKNLVVKAMSRVWLDLTDELKRNNLYSIKGDEKLTDLVNDIVNQKIKNTLAALLKNMSPNISESELRKTILKVLEDAQKIPTETTGGKKAKTLRVG